ncbi:hypothetical protein LZ554_005194 [Drepanopeziza brunnea f. sp. 'monogermtubi']|nr:hypothetical protein LZ554_005194 [Drepanopeziza brunnea f. sp. 'monogermtubi']
MPPRKSDASKVATADEATPGKELAVRDGINIEDLNLPKSIVTRLAKGVLPPNTQIQGNAMVAISKSATVFVNYVASHANEHAATHNRKTIGPQDIFNALDDLDFPDFRDRLEADLAKFHEVQTDKRNAYRSKTASKAADAGDDQGAEDKDGQPAAKKARLEPGVEEEENGEEEAGDAERTPEDEAEDDEGDVPEEVEEEEEEERLESEEQLEEDETKEAEDEALDNGEDSD